MKVLSLFDGISCAKVALERVGFKTDKYYASEVDKYAIKIAQRNYPDTIQLGDVSQIDGVHIGIVSKGIDLLIGGSPCQDLSIAKKNRKGLDGEKSGLFWHFVRIKNEVQPKWFILENVASMSKESKDIISKALGVEPIMINAALVSAQNRKRLFWVGKLVGNTYEKVEIPQPEDRSILLKDILDEGIGGDFENQGKTIIKLNIEKTQSLMARDYKGFGNQRMSGVLTQRIGQIGKGGQGDRIYSPEGKSVGLSALGGGRGAKTGLYVTNLIQGAAKRTRNGKKVEEYNKTEKANSLTSVQTDSMVYKDLVVRKLTPIECERLQSLPDNYTEGISNTQRYKCLGNAFNVEVVAHILKGLIK